MHTTQRTTLHTLSATCHSSDRASSTLLHPIDLLNPAQTCERLALSAGGLLDLVNAGTLSAYDLGDGIRFRAVDVRRLANQVIAS